MSLTWNGTEAGDQARKEMAGRLLRAIIFYQTQHMQRVGIFNPPPYVNSSKPGEYMRKRTGAGQAGVVISAGSIAEVISDDLAVRCGELQNAFYMLVLELSRDRRGFVRTFRDLEEPIAAILDESASAGLV